MDFSIFYQLRTKKIWWVDVVFYFVISLLVSTVLCYLIFILKIYLQQQELKNLDQAILTVGTDAQKDQEKTVFSYQKKINDYARLLDKHKFASNVFGFLEKNTLPNVWFSRFSLPTLQNQLDLAGEAESLDGLSRQTAAFEKNEFVKKVNLLGSNIGEQGKVNFNLSLVLNPKIYNYIPPPVAETPIIPQENVTENPAVNGETQSAEKSILSFDLPLNPEVVGAIDQANHTIFLTVPSGADITNLSTSINASPKAVVSPASNEPQNFTNPVVYTVTAEDGSVQNYTVTASFAAPANAKTQSSKTQAVIIAIVLLGVIVAAGLAIFLFFKKRSKKQKIDMSKISNV